jgi:UDP-N-acetylglucosamine:LPS N-acetylglucosamine transferase
MERIYRAQLRYVPWTYDIMYRLRFRYSGAWDGINAFYTRITRRRLVAWMDEHAPHVVVSLYPLAGTVVARLRQLGVVDIPVATYITDFGVHPLWVHPGADRHICVHDRAALEAERRTGVLSICNGPVVDPVFQPSHDARERGRELLGVDDDASVVLVSGGSWGIGDIVPAVRDIVATRRYVPVVLCGHDEALQARVREAGGVALGWTKDVPVLLAACDALIDNAGGLTCMEAFASGVPVISYRPIAGHGRHNAAEMARAGVSCFPRSVKGLHRALDLVTTATRRREELVTAAHAMYRGDVTKDIIELATWGEDDQDAGAATL